MRMPSRRLLGGIALFATLVVTPVALAGGRAMHHGFGPHRPPESAEDLRDRMEMGVERALDAVDATDEQADKVEAVFDALAPKLYALHTRHDQVRDHVHAALAGQKVDRAALEEARQEGLALADEASALLTDALADAAEVLRPDQRTELADHIQRMHGQE